MNQIQLIHQSLFKRNLSISISFFSVVLTPELEEFVKAYGESVHDQWSYAKVNRPFSLFLRLFNFVFRWNKVGSMVNK